MRDVEANTLSVVSATGACAITLTLQSVSARGVCVFIVSRIYVRSPCCSRFVSLALTSLSLSLDLLDFRFLTSLSLFLRCVAPTVVPRLRAGAGD